MQNICPINFDDFSNLEIWCDKAADKKLLESLKSISKTLPFIDRIEVIPSMGNIQKNPKLDFLKKLLEYDRADFYFFYKKDPILIIELTIHGYTGDNGLQRFARLISAAENKVPVIYFTPFSRTRIDEIETSSKQASKRNVSWNLFMGLKKIYELHDTPIIPISWPIDKIGQPMIASFDAEDSEKEQVFGELISVADHFICSHSVDIIDKKSIKECNYISNHIEILDKITSKLKHRDSEVKKSSIEIKKIMETVQKPEKIIDLIGKDYFFKGKDHKLIAYLAIQESQITHIENINGSMTVIPKLENKLFEKIPKIITDKPSVAYFCGYERRSEPNGGIICNTDYLMCRTGPTVKDRKQNLVLYWPRVFYDKNSKIAQNLIDDLKLTVDGDEETKLSNLLKIKSPNNKNKTYIQSTKSSIGFWNEKLTICRICRNFCDVIILNDAVLFGKHFLGE